ncbi:MAG: hypothetical protein ACKOSQ_00950, partial [Planctomycetaceae bacterium]
MVEACDDALEPDLVLTVAPPVPRRRLLDRVEPPVPGATAAVTPSREPPAPPPVPDAEVPEIWPGPGAESVEPAEPELRGAWPDRRWWVSTGTSTVVHVVVLTILALVVTRPDSLARPRPIEISPPSADVEPLPFLEPVEQLVVEVREPVAEPVADDLVEQAILVEPDSADATAAAFEADDAA